MLITELEKAIDQFTGEELVSKFELLKANTVGKLKGIIEFKKALNFVALNYPNAEEGKQAEAFLKTDAPILEGFKFYAEAAKSWKVVYKIAYNDDKNNKILIDKINKFIASRPTDKLTFSNDIYTLDENFIVIHGITSELYAKGIATILSDYKEYKIPETAIVISNYNYKVVQINKNIEQYLVAPVVAPSPISAKEKVVPVTTPVKAVAPNNLEMQDDNPTDIVPPTNKVSAQAPTPIEEVKATTVIGQGSLEQGQMMKPKK
jgi:hypothetical protein